MYHSWSKVNSFACGDWIRLVNERNAPTLSDDDILKFCCLGVVVENWRHLSLPVCCVQLSDLAGRWSDPSGSQ